MARTPEQDAARKKLLATGKYEEYIDGSGKTNVRLKQSNSSSDSGGSTSPSSGSTVPTGGVSNLNDLAFNAIKGAASIANSLAGAFGMGLPSGLVKAQNDAITSAYNQATQPNRTAQAPVVNPYEEELAKYREQINALATETDPDYNENLEQLSPEEMDEEIL